ncbi:CIC11C00000002333 [Sungouiella intermedia]|uniref:CIC11C00000002333 n=1 Tax=Sungouiella intermedia TaxID=45354 RepID=A0A1L0BWX8_9ASCO|nr:CIC11C00000002333 [[Candida] intermedia]
MFLRRKPPQLSVLEELQQTYNDVCNTTIKNLDLEEKGNFEDALKGWKALHTLLLYKIDVFEKKPNKIHAEEASTLGELKAIRDENVKHLVRLQLRLDEQKRRQKKATEAAPPLLSPPLTSPPVSSSSSHNMSIPSLRNGNPSRSFNNGAGQRQMMKSLRNNSGPSIKLSALNRDAVKQAANISWQKPKKKESEIFDDFDQTEISTTNWERLNSAGSTSTDSSTSSNLIDLDDLQPEEDYFTTSVSKSLEDLSFEPIIKKKAPPPPPPPPKATPLPPARRTHLAPQSTPRQSLSASPPEPRATLAKPAIHMASHSTPDIRAKPSAETRPTKTYTYTQPTPINVKKMMAASSNRMKPTQVKTGKPAPPKAAVKPANRSAVSKTPAPAKPVAQPTSQPATRQVKKSNITYNYKIVEKKPVAGAKPRTQTKKAAPPVVKVEVPPSPTMDDILGGYEEHDTMDAPEQVSKEGDMSPEEMDALIKSIRGIDELAAVQILNDIVVRGDEVYWDDIVGLDAAKSSLKEAVVYPFLRPDLFRGLREPTRGMLLFGPPGTGKTMLARAVATESKSTFFSISSSSLTSKYLGESEKLVKALFLLARKLSPSIVFIDEIDSLLGTRTEGEIESMRRIKNEFLVQWSELSSAAAGRDSAASDVSRVLILGATNLPWGIDDAARRRFAKRVYIPLPEDETRRLQISKLLAYQKNTLLEEDYDKLVELTRGFSGSDITLLAKDSAMGPLRSLGDKLLSTPTDQIRPIQLEDFVESLKYIRPSVSSEGLVEYENWSSKFGSSGA